MNSISCLAGGVVSVVLMLGVGLSWAGPPNPTASDVLANTAGGTNALLNVTIGSRNTAFGFNALFSTTSGNNNTATGVDALFSNTTGFFNTAQGVRALANNTIGNSNVATGRRALYSNTSGNSNIAIGVDALLSNTSGLTNVAIGNLTLSTNTTGNGNIAIGHDAGSSLASGSDNIYLGNPGAATESNTMRLGDVQTRAFIAGISQVTVLNSTPVLIDTTTGQLGTLVSSLRYKRDIRPMASHSQGLYRLRPVVFRYNQDAQGERQYGLIAEEVAKVYPELVTRNAKGQIETIRYHELAPMLLNELQHQQRQLVELKTQNARLQRQLQEQEAAHQAQNAAVAARLERLEAAAARAATLASR